MLTQSNFDKAVRKAKKKGRPLLINFYSPPVCLHWPGQYAAAARQQKEMKHGAVFAKVDLSQQVILILHPAPGVSNEGGISPLLALPAVSWARVPAWGSLGPPRRDGENAQKTGGQRGENGRDTA